MLGRTISRVILAVAAVLMTVVAAVARHTVNDSNDRDRKNSKVAKILVPLIIVIIVAGIWVVKNSQKTVQPGIADNADFTLHVTDQLDLEQLKSYGIPIIIDFGADSCVPCKEMAPVLKELNEELQGKVIIKFVDVWKYRELADGYPIRYIPTQVIFDAKGNPYTPSDPEGMQMNLYTLPDSEEHVFTTHEGGMTKEQLMEVIREMGVN